MVDFAKLGRRKRDIRPEVQALVDRGNITRAEVADLRCNSDEWHAIYPRLDDGAFVAQFGYALKHCSNHRKVITYEDAVVEIFGPELLRRFARLKARPVVVGELSEADMTIAARNIGFDLTCGACAALFYTGHGGVYEHDVGCGTKR